LAFQERLYDGLLTKVKAGSYEHLHGLEDDLSYVLHVNESDLSTGFN
jgi:hypothetical protein